MKCKEETTNLAEEFLECIAVNNVCICLEARLSKSLLQEFCHVQAYPEELALFLLL